MEVDDPAKAAEQQAEQERLQRLARVRKRQEERAAREQEAKAHEEAQQAADGIFGTAFHQSVYR